MKFSEYLNVFIKLSSALITTVRWNMDLDLHWSFGLDPVPDSLDMKADPQRCLRQRFSR
jgi:hypothetical protein